MNIYNDSKLGLNAKINSKEMLNFKVDTNETATTPFPDRSGNNTQFAKTIFTSLDPLNPVSNQNSNLQTLNEQTNYPLSNTATLEEDNANLKDTSHFPAINESKSLEKMMFRETMSKFT